MSYDPYSDYHQKLYNFMNALEIPNFDKFIRTADAESYTALGKAMAEQTKKIAEQTKKIAKERDDLQSFKDDVRNLIKKVLPQ